MERLYPCLSTHTWTHLHHVGLRVGIAALVQALLHRAFELISDLRVSVAVEDAPRPEGWLCEHLALDLAVKITSVRLDVDRLRSAACACTHLELAWRVLEAIESLRVLVDLHVPETLLLDALGVCLEVLHQVLDLLNLSVGVRVHDHSKILHKAEVGAHGISQAGQLTEFGDEGDLVTRTSVLVDQQRLIHVADVLVVLGPVVLLVARRSPLLVEGGCGTLCKVNPIDLVGLLVVAGDDGSSSECFLDRLLAILPGALSFGTKICHVGQGCVSPDDLEADVDVQKDA